MDGWMEKIHRWIDCCMYACMHGWVDGYIDRMPESTRQKPCQNHHPNRSPHLDPDFLPEPHEPQAYFVWFHLRNEAQHSGTKRHESWTVFSVGRSAYTTHHLCRQLVGTSAMGNDRRSANNLFFYQFSNDCLPLDDGSDRSETLAKCVSDDLQFVMCQSRKI